MYRYGTAFFHAFVMISSHFVYGIKYAFSVAVAFFTSHSSYCIIFQGICKYK